MLQRNLTVVVSMIPLLRTSRPEFTTNSHHKISWRWVCMGGRYSSYVQPHPLACRRLPLTSFSMVGRRRHNEYLWNSKTYIRCQLFTVRCYTHYMEGSQRCWTLYTGSFKSREDKSVRGWLPGFSRYRRWCGTNCVGSESNLGKRGLSLSLLDIQFSKTFSNIGRTCIRQ